MLKASHCLSLALHDQWKGLVRCKHMLYFRWLEILALVGNFEVKTFPSWGTLNWILIPRVWNFDSKFMFVMKVTTLSRGTPRPPPSQGITLMGALVAISHNNKQHILKPAWYSASGFLQVKQAKLCVDWKMFLATGLCDSLHFSFLLKENYCKIMFACLHVSKRFHYLGAHGGLNFIFRICCMGCWRDY